MNWFSIFDKMIKKSDFHWKSLL